MSLRLASFNLCSGRSLLDGLTDPARIGAVATTLDADLLALQEVDRHQDRSGGTDQAARVAHALGAVAHRFVPLVTGTPGVPGWLPAPRRDPDATVPDGPSYGVALISRRPVSSWHVLHLDPPAGRWPIPIPSRPPRLLWLADEPRAAVAAVLDHPRITVACTHLSFVPGVNARQLRRVRHWLAALPGPHVLLGDLNLPGRLPARLTGWTPLVTGPTYPSPAPRAQIDHVLASGLSSTMMVTGRILRLPISDHLAVIADLEMPCG
ncbi:MAG TPA: endonuclease/exonuclease/phosphatase family protein [Kineosporiaceae bacterium]|nr:endonuclease/exonuclease/phosphatase family protein [Kineosporiaceae bacterium]